MRHPSPHLLLVFRNVNSSCWSIKSSEFASSSPPICLVWYLTVPRYVMISWKAYYKQGFGFLIKLMVSLHVCNLSCCRNGLLKNFKVPSGDQVLPYSVATCRKLQSFAANSSGDFSTLDHAKIKTHSTETTCQPTPFRQSRPRD